MGVIEISLMGVMILMYTLQSLLTRKYSDHYPGRPEMASPVFTVVSGLAVAVVTFTTTHSAVSFKTVNQHTSKNTATAK